MNLGGEGGGGGRVERQNRGEGGGTRGSRQGEVLKYNLGVKTISSFSPGSLLSTAVELTW